ncbi:hypothetical protein O6H91_04G082500 [Diphasiastrum complanatum]|uniref:Uncharacterized protein n=1 Tax=Diphasiastrum complanatum TaxID=34168 RepID=A0ACC2DYY4_DIPCM|nr:hypothetical protein O6H91_04G082500 [Diphasiastrum complanatum]
MAAAAPKLAPLPSPTAAFHECRSDPWGSSGRSYAKGAFGSVPLGSSTCVGMAHMEIRPLILRFPPNFVRQLSIKARRNCGNIGVAQVVAARATQDFTHDLVEAIPSNGAAAASTLDVATSSSSSSLADLPLPDADSSVLNIAITLNATNSFLACEKTKPRSTSTLAVHGGERLGRPKVADALATPIVQTSTYTFQNTAELIAFQEGSYGSFEYGRYGNPTTHAAESKISALEGAETTLLSASGMCATTTMLLALVPAGGHIVTTTDCYRRTRQFIQTILPKMGITATVIDPADIFSLERALNQNNVSLFFSESPTNPYLRCIDIAHISELCHRRGALVCIDGTFATPINQQALALGADMVLNSATKYIAGHNDVLAGCLSGSRDIIDVVRKLHNILGGVIDPNAAYLILRGMKTLHLRVKQQNTTALKLACALEEHSMIRRVHYPGLESHPEHKIAKKQMTGFGGVISFEIAGDLELTSKFIDGLRIPYIAPSLGGCESLVEQPTIISYWDQSPAQRALFGIKDNLVRFSCGIEDYDDIHADVMQSLAAL